MLLLFFLLSGCGILSKENFCESILLMGGLGLGGREVSVVLWLGLVFSEPVLTLSLILLPS